ncbi:MAG: rRNA cytosine-C5-methyltransferase [Bacteroidales bacterium]|nr:rRNA cytosine-C5-methyltransferase [Bacteroidales bacterium]
MLPGRFIERIREQPYLNAGSLIEALEKPSVACIRTNPLKWDHIPADSTRVPWCLTGWCLDARPSYTLDPLFHAGCYYPQESSSMFLEEVFRQLLNGRKGLRILDLCGAPGGKATHLSSLAGEEGLVVANEVIRSRASVLAENISKWGSSNTLVTNSDPSDFNRLPGFFDVILADAPCSGEGMFRDPVAIAEWSVENTAHCSERQKRILADVWDSLKEGGLLIYSTCTFNPAENEMNIKWLTENLDAESLDIDISAFPGITEIKYHGVTGYGFYPGKINGEGLFMSVAVKKGATPDSPGRGKNPKNDKKPGRAESAAISNWLKGDADNLVMYGDNIIRIPCDNETYNSLREALRFHRAGTLICTVKRDSYIPSHELALSASLNKNAFEKAEVSYETAMSYLRRDNLQIGDAPHGWFLVSYRGINLGFANNLGKRINNYYPVEWRVRMRGPGESGGPVPLTW